MEYSGILYVRPVGMTGSFSVSRFTYRDYQTEDSRTAWAKAEAKAIARMAKKTLRVECATGFGEPPFMALIVSPDGNFENVEPSRGRLVADAVISEWRTEFFGTLDFSPPGSNHGWVIPSVATNDPLSRTNGLSRVIQFDAESFYGTPGLENKTKVKFGISVVTRDGKDYLVARGIRAA